MITGASARARNSAAQAAVVAAALLLLAAQLIALGARSQIFADFHAFYCGGAAVLHHADPYAASALAACQAQPQPFGLHHTQPGVTAPVPFPGYAFVLFAPFALLPYVPAACAWMLLLLGCTYLSGLFLARLSGMPAWAAFAALAVSYPIAVLGLGEVAPIALAALCASALALRAQRYAAAAFFLCVAALLPHVVAPAFLALLVFVPRARVASAVAAAALVALHAAVVGPAAAIEYFTRVLPAHAQSEIGYIAQYGLTWIVHAAGAPDRASVIAGDLSYLALAAAGIAFAGAAARRCADAALAVLVPPAFAVLGGPFMHYSEITLAFPALFLLLRYANGTPRALAAAALVLLPIPWQWIVGEPQLALPAALAAALALGWAARDADLGLRCSAAAVAYGGALLALALHFGPQVQHLQGAQVDPALAQASWTAYIRAQGASAGIVWWIAKAPTWIGLLCLAASLGYVASQKDFVVRVPVEAPPAAL